MTASAASAACARVSATTAATMSPTNRTLSVANTGRFSVWRHHRELLQGRQAEIVASRRGRRPATPGIDVAVGDVDRDHVGVRDGGTHEGHVRRCPAPPGRRRTSPRRSAASGSSRRRTAFPRIEPDAAMTTPSYPDQRTLAARPRPPLGRYRKPRTAVTTQRWEPTVGIEPTTFALRVRPSTD